MESFGIVTSRFRVKKDEACRVKSNENSCTRTGFRYATTRNCTLSATVGRQFYFAVRLQAAIAISIWSTIDTVHIWVMVEVGQVYFSYVGGITAICFDVLDVNEGLRGGSFGQ
ncbi:hypothetical protein GWI33_014829 [Rhynchophorus ferrugineus]|uniref:Uncharacterized protein n=1 Tax=Rhynchophorus ferrugineus TaxID=354439 RepID=A0A834M546_RHYFE|nr:hypothetical protein GWI33_014829 [Rhynchophorus ferrugineus]